MRMPCSAFQPTFLMELQFMSVCYDMFATHIPRFAGALDIISSFWSTEGQLDLGEM